MNLKDHSTSRTSGLCWRSFEYIAWHTKTMKIALDIGPTDMKIREKRFMMRWKGHGASDYFPQLALPVASDLMRRGGLPKVPTDTVAWILSTEAG